MGYLSKEDLQSSVRDETLNQILHNSDPNSPDPFKQAAKESQDIVKDHLIRYQIDEELQKQGDDRHGSILFHMKNICIYILYERVPDDEVPDRIIKNYNDSMKALIDISKKKVPLSIPVVQIDTDGDGLPDKPKTRFRSGGEKPRHF